MDTNYGKIRESLREAGKKALLIRLGEGAALLGTIFLILFLAGLISAAQLSLIPYARMAYLTLSALIIVYVSYRYVLVPILPLRSEHRLALLIERRLPVLKDLLISSLQLGRDLEDPGRARLFSHELVGSLFEQTGERLQGLRHHDIVERRGLRRNLLAFTAALTLFVAIAVLNPGYIVQRFNILSETHYSPSALLTLGKPVIGDITLTYRYPAYTGLKPRTVRGSSGDIRALKGSAVEISARSNQPLDSASILLNESTRIPMVVETANVIRGSLVVLEDGSYSFETLSAGGASSHRSKSHSIVVETDEYPRINILSPAPGKVVSERDVIELEYKAADDFGLRGISLVVGEGQETGQTKKCLKVMKEGETECKGTYKWDLSTLRLTPGEKLRYHLEAADNDAVSGPKVARSETRYLEIYSSQRKHEELLSLQEELLNGMIRLLAEKLVNRPDAAESRDELLIEQEVLTDRTIRLLVLFDRVLTNMEEDALANYAVYYSLENMSNMISRLNDTKKRVLEKIERRGTVLSTTSIDEIKGVQDKEVVELENDIMFLVELLRKQRLDDLLDQDRKMVNMQKTLTNLLDELSRGKTDELEQRVMKEMERLEDMMRSMLEKLSKMSSNWGDEFLNLDGIKDLQENTLDKDLQEMREALAEGDLEAALKAAQNALNALEQMLAEMGKNAQQYVDSAFSRTLEEMSTLDKELRELEEGERKVAGQTEKLKKDVQSRTFGDMDKALNEFFERQLERLKGMKNDVSQIEKSFAGSPIVEDYSRLQRESERLVKKRTQAMRSRFQIEPPYDDGFSDEDYAELNEKLRERNKARNEEPLLDIYDMMSEAIPELNERLSQLGEMLKGQDFKESLNMAKESLKSLRFWDYEMARGSELSRRYEDTEAEGEEPPGEGLEGLKKETGETLADARRLNQEMVEELESVRKSFEKMKGRELTGNEKAQFEQLARQQGDLKDQAKGLADLMDELAGRNPSMGSEPGEMMGDAQAFMEGAEGKLQRGDGPRALMDERESLYRLSQARKSLGEAMDRVAKGMMSHGIPMPRYVLRYPLRWREGVNGPDTGDVEIPSGESYKVPREFREDILDAMKKGLPEKYQELNKDYYRKLVE